MKPNWIILTIFVPVPYLTRLGESYVTILCLPEKSRGNLLVTSILTSFMPITVVSDKGEMETFHNN